MKKVDYSTIDALIFQKISSGENTFSRIGGGEVFGEADRISNESGGEAFRVIDRRLQALRKAGKIKYTTADKWIVA